MTPLIPENSSSLALSLTEHKKEQGDETPLAFKAVTPTRQKWSPIESAPMTAKRDGLMVGLDSMRRFERQKAEEQAEQLAAIVRDWFWVEARQLLIPEQEEALRKRILATLSASEADSVADAPESDDARRASAENHPSLSKTPVPSLTELLDEVERRAKKSRALGYVGIATELSQRDVPALVKALRRAIAQLEYVDPDRSGSTEACKAEIAQLLTTGGSDE